MRHLYLLSLLITTHLAYSQTDSLQTIELANVIIAENRIQTPFSETARNIHIITPQDIQQTPAQSVNELLSYVPGVDIRQRGPIGVQADVSIRGGTFEQTLVLINGVKVSDPQTGHHLLNLPLDKNAIERIEVLKGPGARIYGQNAFAGAINIITKVPEERAVSAGAYGGDFTTGGGNAGLALPGKRYGQYLSVARDQSEGYRPNADYRINNVFYQSYLKAGSGQFNLMGGYTQRSFGAGGFYVENSQEYEEVNTALVSLDYQGTAGSWTYLPRLYWRRNHDDYVFLRDQPNVYNNLHTTHSTGAELHTTYQNILGATGLGVEIRNERIDSNGIRSLRDSAGAVTDTVAVSFLGQRQRTTVGLFAEHRFTFFDRLDVTPGLYLNWYSDYGWNYFPGLDASLDITEAWKAFGNVGRSFRIPTYTDLYYEGPNNIGNTNLQPEDAITYEIGTKYFGKNLWGQVSYFFRDGSKIIDWTRANADTPWQPQNFNNVGVQGIEAELNVDFQDSWMQRLSLSYTYLDAQVDNPEGVESRYALSNLNHQLIFSANHRIAGPVYHSLQARYLERVLLKDYFILDSRIYYQTERFQLYAEATNITNTQYTEAGYVEMPGRWLRIGASVNFPY